MGKGRGSDDEEEDEYGDDDFEEYDDDDFEEDEEEEEPPPPPARIDPPAATRPPPRVGSQEKIPSRVGSYEKLNPVDALIDSINAENDVAMMMSRAGTPSNGDRYHDARPSTSQRGPGASRPTTAYSQQLPERRVVGLPTKQNMEQDLKKEVTAKRVARWKAICKEVKMQEVAEDNIFDLPPLSLRELADLGRGSFAKLSVAGVQTNDDARTIDTQTEEMEARAVAAQCPEDLGLSRDVLEQASNLARKRNRALPGWTSTAGALQGDRNRRLNNFVKRYGPIVDALLNERANSEVSIFSHMDNSASKGDSLSACFVKLSAPSSKSEAPNASAALLANRRVTCAAYSPSPSIPHLLTSYAPSVSGTEAIQDHGLSGKGLLAVWDMGQADSPKHILVSEGSPTCCVWSPKKPNFAIAGMEEGGLCLWDVREPASLHPSEGKVVCRQPTYSTEFSSDIEGLGPIAAVHVTTATDQGVGDSVAGGQQFQLVALDRWGLVSVWMVMEVASADLAGSDVDFGLRIGGRVKMLLTCMVSQYGPAHEVAPAGTAAAGLDAPAGSAVLPARKLGRQTADLGVTPGDPNQFLVAADQGLIMRGSRYGQPPPPRMYILDDPLIGAGRSFVTTATSVNFSPYFAGFFLAAYSPAAVALYHLDVGLALLTITDITAGEIVCVRWSPSKPSAFFALDTKSTIYCYDLLSRNPTKPIHSERFGAENSSKGTVTSFEVSNSAPVMRAEAADGEGLAAALGTSADFSKDGGQHSFVLTYDDGRVDVHMLSRGHIMEGGLKDFATSAGFKDAQEYLNRFLISQKKEDEK